MKRGAFITLYGINNIGKTTHARLLCERLRAEGCHAVYLKYPIYTLEPTGPRINEILRGGGAQGVSEQELQTLFMQNRHDYEVTLQQMLAEGVTVVAEDYTGTGVAWGTAKGLERKWVEDLNRDLLQEDFSLLLVGQRAMNAREARHIHENDDGLVLKVQDILVEMGNEKKWHVVQQQATKEETAELIWREVVEFLKHFSP